MLLRQPGFNSAALGANPAMGLHQGVWHPPLPRQGALVAASPSFPDAAAAAAAAAMMPALLPRSPPPRGSGMRCAPPDPRSSCSVFRYRMKSSRWRPAFALETDGLPNNADGQDFDEDSGFLGRTRLGRLIQAAGRELLEKLNSARTNPPTKIFLVLFGFYTANALATILGQTGDWDVLVAGVIVAAIEGIGRLMYRKQMARPPPSGRFQSFISMVTSGKHTPGPFCGCLQGG